MRRIQTRLYVWGEPRDTETVTRGSEGGGWKHRFRLCAGRLPYFLLSFVGSKAEAQGIKATIGDYLQQKLRLEMSAAKTLITHARTEQARFLGYAISVYHDDNKLTWRSDTEVKGRWINAKIRLGVPPGYVTEHVKRYQSHGKPTNDPTMLHFSDAQIIQTYQQRFRGIAQYYKYAIDRNQLTRLQWAMEATLVRTLANKFKCSIATIYRRYRHTRTVDGFTYKTLQVAVPTQNGDRIIYWGAIPLKVVQPGSEALVDQRRPYTVLTIAKSDLLQRLQAEQCELCGATDNVEVHHVRKLSDLKRRWQGRKTKPLWVQQMIAFRRKTLVVCAKCHDEIHAGNVSSNHRQ